MTTRIRITADSAIADGRGHRYTSGQVVDVDDTLARNWIAAGHAEPLGSDTSTRPEAEQPRTATTEAPHRGVSRSRKSK
ncbi:hypothetical protein [Saccharopolyspora kobensis]|nr:hypothetical protein [Saccharopolyspora kobensis]